MTPKPVPPTIREACERVAAWLHADDDSDVPLFRSDLTALVAHCGWGMPAEQARNILPVVDEPMFDGVL